MRQLVRRWRSVLLPVVGLLLLVGIWSLLAARTTAGALDRARDALGEARDSLARADADAANDAIDQAARDLQAARSATAWSPLGLARPLPLLGSPARAVDGVDDAGARVISAARTLTEAVDSFPTSGGVGVDGKDLAPFRAAALDSATAIKAARVELDRALRALDGPSGAALPMISSPARELAGELTAAQDQLDGAERGLTLLADLSAPDTDAKILLLSQDTMELRATGGFIGSWGIIRFDQGTVRLERYDSFDVLPPPDPPMEAPADLARSLNSRWSLENANWSPDFPTSAATAREMFRRQGGGEVDGVVAITELVMADLVGALGPIQVPGYAEPVVEDGFAERVLYEVELKRPADRPTKRFLSELSDLVFDRLFSMTADEVPVVLDALGEAGAVGDVQAWFPDVERQGALAGTSFAGALPEPDGDFLMLVDSNMTASKANADLVRDVTYEVEEAGDRLLATLTVEVRNEGAERSVNRYYNGWLRVYVPEGSELLNTDEQVYNRGTAPEGGFSTFATNLYVLPLDNQTVTFEYLLPERISGGDYSLQWVRQSGTRRDELVAVLDGDPITIDRRSMSVGGTIGEHGLRGFLHDRWLLRRLGL